MLIALTEGYARKTFVMVTKEGEFFCAYQGAKEGFRPLGVRCREKERAAIMGTTIVAEDFGANFSLLCLLMGASVFSIVLMVATMSGNAIDSHLSAIFCILSMLVPFSAASVAGSRMRIALQERLLVVHDQVTEADGSGKVAG